MNDGDQVDAAPLIGAFVGELRATEFRPGAFVERFAGLIQDSRLLESVVSAIADAYDAEPEFRDGYSRLAFLLWGEKRHAEARQLWDRDIACGRITWRQRLKHADSFAEEGRLAEAEVLVAAIYDECPQAVGGYAGLGWRIRNQEPLKALALFEQDQALKRVSPEFQARHALLLAKLGRGTEARLSLLAAWRDLPAFYQAYHQVGETLVVREQWDDFVTHYRQAPFSNWHQSAASGATEPSVAGADGTLYAFYDLQCAAPTFDFTVFLANAEMCRKRLGLATVQPVIVPGSPDTFPAWYPLSAAAQAWRLGNIVLPACHLLPSCAGVLQCASRDEACRLEDGLAKHRFPVDYSVRRPTVDFYFRCRATGTHPAACLQPPSYARQQVRMLLQRLAGGRQVVTVTLRETNVVDKQRNSDLAAWSAFIAGLDTQRYFPIVLRDQEKALWRAADALLPHCHFPEAVWSLELRSALYAESFLNLGVSNGPMMLAMLLQGSRCLVFKLAQASADVATLEFMRDHCDLQPGGQLQQASPWQRFVWEDDTAEVIDREFARMTEQLASATDL